MAEIILTEEQTRVVAAALTPVQVLDSKGNVLGTIPPLWTEDEIRKAKRILAETKTWYTTEQALGRLHSGGEK